MKRATTDSGAKTRGEEPKRAKGWGPETKASDDPWLCRELFRLHQLDKGERDPNGTYTVAIEEDPEAGLTHKFLKSGGKLTGHYKSKATYSVFEDYRWFASEHPVELDLIVLRQGNPYSSKGPYGKLASALSAFRDHVPTGVEGKGQKAIRHNCQYSLKKKKTAEGKATKDDSKPVCFSAQCIIGSWATGGDLGTAPSAAGNVRKLNEDDKHFHYFLHHNDPNIQAAGRAAFGRGGVLEGAYLDHFGRPFLSNK